MGSITDGGKQQRVAMTMARAERGLMFHIPSFRAAAAIVSCSIWNDSEVQSLVGIGRHWIKPVSQSAIGQPDKQRDKQQADLRIKCA